MNPHFHRSGTGQPLVFQHGLGGNLEQTRLLLEGLPRTDFLTMDCPGHGKTPATDPERISFAGFADELLGLCDRLGLDQAVFGGISMGAGLALHLAAHRPERVRALILVRPAWLDQPLPANLAVLHRLGELLERGLGESIRNEASFREMNDENPAAAASVLGQLTREQGEHTARLLLRMCSDRPIDSLRELRRIRIPALILASQDDPLHPFSFGESLRDHLPKARLAEVPSRYRFPEEHQTTVFREVGRFLDQLG
ncbi:MAG: alpha/beta hydrolase [Bacteroidales bacterium]